MPHRARLFAVVIGGAAMVGACGSGGRPQSVGVSGTQTIVSAPSSTGSTVTTVTVASSTTSTTTTPPHFASPQAAMAYLAAAWNANDLVSLKHVTNPAARAQLDDMHMEASNLRLDRCQANPAGDYTCYFKHDYPPGYAVPPGAPGEAVFLVGPADIPGWYMTVFQSCG